MEQAEARQGTMFRALRFRDLRLVWAAQVLSELGDWAARVALALLVLDRTGSKVLTAAVTAAGLLPWIGLGQALAALGDRFPRRSLMVACDLIRAVAFLAITVVKPVWLLLLLAFLAASAAPPFEAARAAIIPEVVPEDVYGDALTLSNVTYQTVLLLGYVLGGGLVALIGTRNALGVNAATFVASAGLLSLVTAGRTSRPAVRVGVNLRLAASKLFTDPYLRRAAAILTIGGSCAIVGEALVAVYVRENLPSSGAWAVGALAAMVPAGTIIASALVKRRGEHEDLLRASAFVVLIGSAAAIPWFLLSPPNLLAAFAFVSIGITSAMVIPTYAVLGARIPEGMRATAFGLLQGMMLGTQALAAIAGGGLAILVRAGPASAFALFPALGYALYAFLVAPGGRLMLRGHGARTRHTGQPIEGQAPGGSE